MKETASQKFRLGLFTILGTLVFVAAIYFIGNKQDLFGRTAELNAIFNDVNGLQPGNNVRYSGIDIGTVRHIEMVNDSAIKVEMAIDRTILPRIKTDAVATINSDGLVGSMIVNIIPGRGRKPSVEENATIASYSRVRTDDMLKTLSVTNENAALLTRDLLKITNQITQGQGSVGVLLNDQQLAADIKETVRYLKISSQETAASMAQVNKLLASLDHKDNAIGVLKDTAVAGQLKRTVANLEQSSRAVNQTLGKLDAAVAEIKDGQGAVNYLTKDPKSARQIDSMMTNINKAAILLQQDLEALKHNFLLRGYFKKQEKKAKKQP